MRTIVAVGAYERDNFGDYLFYEVLRRYLPHDEIIPGSVMVADMQAAYGLQTVSYDFVLSHHQVDAVVVVGGEIGGVDVPKAMMMSLDEQSPLQYRAEQQPDRWLRLIEEAHGASRRNIQAYIPDMSLYQRYNAQTPLYVNSAGLQHLFAAEYAEQALAVLRQARRVVVRDTTSADKLQQAGITTAVAPDVVHSLPRLYRPNVIPSVGVVVQCNTRYIDQVGESAMVSALERVASMQRQSIHLLAAGTSYSHDSFEHYQRMATALRQRGVTVEVVQTRNPLELVDIIASARLTISTSLHVRIVSAAYGVPRISLQNDKVGHYVAQWDQQWPAQVDPTQLSQAVQRTKTVARRWLKRTDLTTQALDSLQRMAQQLPVRPLAPSLTTAQLQAEWTEYQRQMTLQAFREVEVKAYHLDQRVAQLELGIKQLEKTATYHEQQVAAITSSRSWRLLCRLRALFAFQRR